MVTSRFSPSSVRPFSSLLFSQALLLVALLTSLLLTFSAAHAQSALLTVKVAVLQFGTLNWEMDVIRQHQLDRKHGFQLDVTPVGGKNASSVALQSGAVDLIYSDWVWVNRQRHARRMYSFSPVSAAAGGVYLQPDLNVDSLKDFDGQRLGIAGGAVDKSWLLLQAYAKQQGIELQQTVQPVFAAPPLLNKLMFDNKLEASLNFWHYSARLKARGYRSLITVQQVLEGLGIRSQVPLVGWVVSDDWAQDNSALLNRFLLASSEARQILLTSDAEWQRIKPLTKSEDDAIFNTLRDEYRKGVLTTFNADNVKALHALYDIFAREGGKQLTGGANTLDDSMFLMPVECQPVSRCEVQRVSP